MSSPIIARSALVLIDVQQFLLGLELQPHSGSELATRSAALAETCRAAGVPVFYVRVELAELVHHEVDRPLMDPSMPAPPPQAADLIPDAGFISGDTLVTKRHWGAFQSTELDLLLRRRGIATIILGGAVTNFGVESTARMALDLGYDLVFAEDAITGVDPGLHEAALRGVFPFMGRVMTSEAIAQALVA